MKTYFIGKEEVRGYLVDLLRRLDPMPLVWCPMTASGVALARELATLAPPDLQTSVEVHAIAVVNEALTLPEESAVRGRAVLLLDSAVHSGRMMSHCASEILKFAPSSLTTYALAVRRCSSFFPTLWGVMTDEADRPYFLLDSIPNNRLNAGAVRPQPSVHMRLLAESHLSHPPIASGLDSIDRVTWADRLFQMNTTPGTYTYVLERGSEIVGFVTVHQTNDNLSVAEVVVDTTLRDSGYGGILIRFAETLARQGNCQTVRLNAIEARTDLYKRFGYRRSSKPELKLGSEVYHPMEREVLYHQGKRHVDGSTVTLPSDLVQTSH